MIEVAVGKPPAIGVVGGKHEIGAHFELEITGQTLCGLDLRYGLIPIVGALASPDAIVAGSRHADFVAAIV